RRPDVAWLATEDDLPGAVDWWARQCAKWIEAGIAGFRCIRPDQVPADFWRELITAVRLQHARVNFMASTLGVGDSEKLAECGFDLVASCSGNWDYRAADFLDTVDHLAHIAPIVAMPEAPFDRRLSRAFRDTGRARRAAQRALAFAT